MKPIVSTQWLAEHINDPDLVILDATFHLPNVPFNAREDYTHEHIPGALFFELDAVADQACSLPHMLPSPEIFSAIMGMMGISNNKTVIAYDSYGLFSASRVWWMLRIFGHENIAILDGGLPKWQQEGHPVTDRIETPTPASFKADFNPAMVVHRDEVKIASETGDSSIFDARSNDRFTGKEEEPRPGMSSGHIPKSTNIPFGSLLHEIEQTLLDEDDLRKVFDAAGYRPGKPIICSCGSGVTACTIALGLHLIGEKNVKVYDGSWSEWGANHNLPVER
jgi:thiosulfate/3-mercaptopyruvate sulfurtransferase